MVGDIEVVDDPEEMVVVVEVADVVEVVGKVGNESIVALVVMQLAAKPS